MVENVPAVQETGFDPWIGKIPWRRERQPTPIFLLEESHGQGSLVGYSSWCREELDMLSNEASMQATRTT